MSTLIIISGLIGFSLIVSMDTSTSQYKNLMKENEIAYLLNMNMLFLEASANEYIISGDDNKISEFRFRSAKIQQLIERAESEIEASQMTVIIKDLKKSLVQILSLFHLIQINEAKERSIVELHSIFTFVRNNLEIASNSMKLSSDNLDKVQSRIAEKSLYTVILLLITEIILILITGFLFMELILKPVRNLQTLLSEVIDSMPSVLIGIYENKKIVLWNRNAEAFTGVTKKDAIGAKLVDVFPMMSDEIDHIIGSIEKSEILKDTKKTQLRDQTTFHDIVVYPIKSKDMKGAVIRVDDVTERIRLEEMMIQSEKMLSIGGLAAGMAHEINNPLAGLIQTANTISRRLSLGGKVDANYKAAQEAGISISALLKYLEIRNIPRMLDNMNDSGKRVAVLINNMLSFARKDERRKILCNIPELLNKSLDLAGTDYNLKKQYDFKTISIIKEFEPNIPQVLCEETKIQQVFLNLFRNSADAMINFKTENPSLIIRVYEDRIKKLVCIEIEDNGPGMSDDVRKRVFEPFFTTKPQGIGTGLGLSVSYFIITENHSGFMSVQSGENRGAKFIVSLPYGGAIT